MEAEDTRIKVFYSQGGPHVILHWWTYDRRGHLIVARNEASLLRTASRVLANESDAEIKDYCRADIVAPTQQMHVRQAERYRRNAVDMFWQEVASRASDMCEEGVPLPLPLVACPEFKPEDEDYKEPEDEDEQRFQLRHHFGCLNCTNGIALVGITPETLYNVKRERFQALKDTPRNRHYKGRDDRAISKAPEANERDELWMAVADPGHHAHGSHLGKLYAQPDVDDEPDRFYSTYPYTSELFNGLLFLFKRGEDLDTAPVLAIIASAKAEAEAWTKAEADRRAREDKVEKKQEHAFIRLLFGEGKP